VGVAFAAVLPALRFVAESGEHDYATGTTRKTGRFGGAPLLRWLLHPHGDGHHFLHHVDPSIPHHRLRAVHRWLSRNDAGYRVAGTERPSLPVLAVARPDEAQARSANRTLTVHSSPRAVAV
jgi:fatty acid desaturase